jgi:hypothetical protein
MRRTLITIGTVVLASVALTGPAVADPPVNTDGSGHVHHVMLGNGECVQLDSGQLGRGGPRPAPGCQLLDQRTRPMARPLPGGLTPIPVMKRPTSTSIRAARDCRKQPPAVNDDDP